MHAKLDMCDKWTLILSNILSKTYKKIYILKTTKFLLSRGPVHVGLQASFIYIITQIFSEHVLRRPYAST